MQPDWTPEEQELVRRFARGIVDRGMAMPATLFLESVRPLHFVGGNFLHFLSPMAGLIVPRWELDQLGTLLENREAVPYLVEVIERLENEREAAARAAKRARRAAGQVPQRRRWRFWRRGATRAPEPGTPPPEPPGPVSR